MNLEALTIKMSDSSGSERPSDGILAPDAPLASRHVTYHYRSQHVALHQSLSPSICISPCLAALI